MHSLTGSWRRLFRVRNRNRSRSIQALSQKPARGEGLVRPARGL